MVIISVTLGTIGSLGPIFCVVTIALVRVANYPRADPGSRLRSETRPVEKQYDCLTSSALDQMPVRKVRTE